VTRRPSGREQQLVDHAKSVGEGFKSPLGHS
jgi:hypothetical protein